MVQQSDVVDQAREVVRRVNYLKKTGGDCVLLPELVDEEEGKKSGW
jgi:hypothetical protein